MKTNIAAKINALWEPHKWTLLRSQTGGGNWMRCHCPLAGYRPPKVRPSSEVFR